jgi:23S rRNA (guanosine2251-2'-O)-methyltransferase
MKKQGGRRTERASGEARGARKPAPKGKSPHPAAAPPVSPRSPLSPQEPAPGRAQARPGWGGIRAFRRPSPELAAIYGFHAVREALRNQNRACLDLFATPAAAEKLAEDLAARSVPLHIVEPEALAARLGADAVHQGVLLEARPLPALDVTEIENKSGLVLALDQITDPHNVGAILRTAAAFAVDAIIVTERNAPEFSGVLAKTASGGLEHAPLVEVVNLARALDQLGKAGYLRVGLDSEGPASLEKTPLSRPVALVLGAEGKGLRRLTREKCDVLARLDMPGAIKSLNVSNACAVALALTRTILGE